MLILSKFKVQYHSLRVMLVGSRPNPLYMMERVRARRTYHLSMQLFLCINQSRLLILAFNRLNIKSRRQVELFVCFLSGKNRKKNQHPVLIFIFTLYLIMKNH